MTQSEVLTASRPFHKFCEENSLDFKEIMENVLNNESDFEVDDYRFILESEIDEIQKEELESDPYILGCFNDWFIADNTDLSYDIVKALQEGEKYEELGQHIIDNNFVSEMQEGYSSADGYGAHFNHYDGNMDEIEEYLIFRTN